MKRRIHVKQLAAGEVILDTPSAHHARDVLRLEAGTEVELFDDAGATAVGMIVRCSPREVAVRVEWVTPAIAASLSITVAAAVPKANRADWMIEKLSELGIDEFIPLQTARSVVHPEGKNKLERWERLAAEAAKQSRRRGVMRVRPLAAVETVVKSITEAASAGWYFSTSATARPVGDLLASPSPSSLTLLIGPEGGWTDEETTGFDAAGLIAVALTDTVLRVETAALAAAAVVATIFRARIAAEPSP